MLQGVWQQLQAVFGFGLDAGEMHPVQIVLRTVLVYVATLVIVRLGSKRFLAEATAFDVIVGIMLGSVMSRAISGSAPFFPTLLAGAALLALHWLFAVVAYHTNWFGAWIKGERVLLIKDGEIQRDGMQRASITSDDLKQALRLQTSQADPSTVELAYLERNGQISVIPYEREPRIVDVSVKDGVQTVRIQLD